MGNKKKIKYHNKLEDNPSGFLSVSTPISQLESKIRFSFRNCDMKEFCIRHLDNEEINALYKRLTHFENMTWQAVKQLSREKGFSSEKRISGNFNLLSQKFSIYNSFFHFRVNGTKKPFRVFASQYEDMCCILLIDREGSVNH